MPRLAKANDAETRQGLAGNDRVAYSPGLFGHLFAEYGNVFECLAKLDTIAPDDAPPSATNFAPCYGAEFPADAALVKMSWQRASYGTQDLELPFYDTSAGTLRDKMAAKTDDGGWGKGTGKAFPTESEIYMVTMADGTKLVEEIEFPRGHAGNPMTDTEVESKFQMAVEPRYGKERADGMLARCWDLENVTSVTELIRLFDA